MFELTPAGPTNCDWRETLLHSFRAETETDGAHPVGSIVIDSSGVLYGVTYVGWGHAGAEQIVTGKIYELTPPTAGNPNWTLTILHAFSPDDGQRPLAGLISDGSGGPLQSHHRQRCARRRHCLQARARIDDPSLKRQFFAELPDVSLLSGEVALSGAAAPSAAAETGLYGVMCFSRSWKWD